MFTHPLHKDSSLESLYGQYEQKAKVEQLVSRRKIIVLLMFQLTLIRATLQAD